MQLKKTSKIDVLLKANQYTTPIPCNIDLLLSCYEKEARINVIKVTKNPKVRYLA